jgi:hypothetical protein
MQREVDCLILWHYFDAKGKLINASGTHLVGSMMDLQERLSESHRECRENREARRPYIIPVQIISTGVRP